MPVISCINSSQLSQEQSTHPCHKCIAVYHIYFHLNYSQNLVLLHILKIATPIPLCVTLLCSQEVGQCYKQCCIFTDEEIMKYNRGTSHFAWILLKINNEASNKLPGSRFAVSCLVPSAALLWALMSTSSQPGQKRHLKSSFSPESLYFSQHKLWHIPNKPNDHKVHWVFITLDSSLA